MCVCVCVLVMSSSVYACEDEDSSTNDESHLDPCDEPGAEYNPDCPAYRFRIMDEIMCDGVNLGSGICLDDIGGSLK